MRYIVFEDGTWSVWSINQKTGEYKLPLPKKLQNAFVLLMAVDPKIGDVANKPVHFIPKFGLLDFDWNYPVAYTITLEEES